RGINSLRHSRGELLSINANIAPHGCDVFDRNEKVQKAPKHDFWTYWSVLGAFVAKTHFVIRAANFCQLMPILAYIGTHGCDVFDRNEKVRKAAKHDFWTYWSVLGAFEAKTHFVIRAENFCQLMPLLAHVGTIFSTKMKKFKKHQNMIFGHIGVYWVRSRKKIPS
ncbi:hypothetical protein NY537_09765, partial [Curtobacterium flaccumfaciens pv. betae]|uniref:hypothetical protein n=1 Tax=Curtobacterium flaccumfaciens TaxID=2035 RepID=UPI00265A50C9